MNYFYVIDNTTHCVTGRLSIIIFSMHLTLLVQYSTNSNNNGTICNEACVIK